MPLLNTECEGDGGVQGQKSDLILYESTFHCGSNAANRVAKVSTVLKICAVEVCAFFYFIRKFGVQNWLIFVTFRAIFLLISAK